MAEHETKNCSCVISLVRFLIFANIATNRQNFANVVGQNHAQALIITQFLKVFIYPDFLPSEYYCRLRQEPRSQFPQRSDLLSASGTWLSPSHLPDLSDNPDIIWEKDILGEFHLILPENPSRHTWSSSSTHLFIKKKWHKIQSKLPKYQRWIESCVFVYFQDRWASTGKSGRAESWRAHCRARCHAGASSDGSCSSLRARCLARRWAQCGALALKAHLTFYNKTRKVWDNWCN